MDHRRVVELDIPLTLFGADGVFRGVRDGSSIQRNEIIRAVLGNKEEVKDGLLI